MGLRSWLANRLIGMGRKVGRGAGRELKVELSDHTINLSMADPSEESLAWDDDHYRYGCMFYRDYSNPIKPTVRQHKDLDDPDVVEAEDGPEVVEDDVHTELISSPRYRAYMRQDLIDSLLTPRTQWRLIAFAVIALGIVMTANLIATLSAAGLF